MINKFQDKRKTAKSFGGNHRRSCYYIENKRLNEPLDMSLMVPSNKDYP